MRRAAAQRSARTSVASADARKNKRCRGNFRQGKRREDEKRGKKQQDT
jgi:hypothetical protein